MAAPRRTAMAIAGIERPSCRDRCSWSRQARVLPNNKAGCGLGPVAVLFQACLFLPPPPPAVRPPPTAHAVTRPPSPASGAPPCQASAACLRVSSTKSLSPRMRSSPLRSSWSLPSPLTTAQPPRLRIMPPPVNSGRLPCSTPSSTKCRYRSRARGCLGAEQL